MQRHTEQQLLEGCVHASAEPRIERHRPRFSRSRHETRSEIHLPTHPAGGWGSVQSLGRLLARGHVPLSCLAAYYPECNPLVPAGSFVPAAKGVPVPIEKMGARVP